ncbi:helix-turn-helix domain-containing protein [Bradyrhizobium japonicum]|uniref:helix-turn-helix domain-containing protein n=1 Tax=Bradyrhizobium japonicum TaxID=375 RepID=UPI0027148381|nr:helix-turn-helix transcriptional regulator [Bradyrhizobium japonicum]WLB57453.1 helix-turn-helix transcriptional regulator [Bradyrhizobium japonicum]
MNAEATDIFKERLKAARDLRGLSQSQLASNAKLPPSSVSHFEAGTRKPSFENLKRLAVALDVTTDYLLGRADAPNADGTVGRLHRDIHNLSHDDMKLAEDFVGMLLKRASAAKKDD